MKRPYWSRICIVGVGLIGGSLGLAIKKRRLAPMVVGVARKASTLKTAIRLGAIDAGTRRLAEGVRGADLVILCGPVSVIEAQLKSIGKWIPRHATVIDVGSTKERISRASRSLGRRFVGCHPMAGSEKTGVENARADLFKGEICFVTSPAADVRGFWTALGARPVTVSPNAHDRWAAAASHLPHVFAFTLFSGKELSAPVSRSIRRLNPSAAALARLAKSQPSLWADILVSNRRSLSPQLAAARRTFASIESALRRRNRAALAALIRKANVSASQHQA